MVAWIFPNKSGSNLLLSKTMAWPPFNLDNPQRCILSTTFEKEISG